MGQIWLLGHGLPSLALILLVDNVLPGLCLNSSSSFKSFLKRLLGLPSSMLDIPFLHFDAVPGPERPTRAQPLAFPRNPRGRLGFPGPTQGEFPRETGHAGKEGIVVLEEALESPLDCKEIHPVHSEGRDLT